MPLRMLKKAEIEKLVKEYEGALYVEKWLQSKSYQYLKLNTGKEPHNFGRVSENIFRWFKLVLMDQQPGFMNVQWYKFLK